MTDECRSTQLIDGDGVFNVAGMDNFTKIIKLGECGLSYAVVSIMGPQSSGKSTLLNHLFRTNFREMEAFRGISQTTKGIWLAKCAEIEPCTIVMDLEGTDGRERGEDDTAFEKQSALFALAVSDIVLINMWCHDIGREQAANRPLLKTVFQAMMRLFSTRKTTLLFVIRDKRRTPLEKLESILREDIQKIWDSVPKPQAHKETPLSNFFNVEVVALSSYEEKEELFKEQVASLRQRFFNSIAPGGLAGDRRGGVPASGFSLSTQEIWKIIKQNKDLDLPAHKVMVATVRCEEFANKKYADFVSDKHWLQLEKAAQEGAVRNFGKTLSSMWDKCLSGYDMEATYFDDAVRTAKRQQLESKILQLVHPAFQSMLGHLRSKALDDFKASLDNALGRGEGFAVAARDCTISFMTSFDEGSKDAAIAQAKWDSSKVREKLHRDIDAHVASVRAAKLSELTSKFEGQLNKALAEPVEALLDAASDDTWPAIRKLLQRETKSAVSGLSSALSSFDIDQVTLKNILAKLEDYARSVVESKSREEAGRVLIRMKDRFSTLFSRDSDSMPRVWTGKEDIRAITKTARSASLKLLSVMAAIRLDEENDKIENTLSLALVDAGGAAAKNRSIQSVDPLASSSWEEVPPEKTLITPVQCKYLWRQFNSEMEYTVTQAISAQVMVATVRCEEIANEKFADFAGDEDWLQLEEAAQVGVVHNFGKKLSSLLDKCLSGYDMEATYFDDAVRTAKRKQLESKLLQLVCPAFQSVLEHLMSKALDDFMASLDNALGRGEDFAVAAHDCTKSFMTSFDEGFKDAAIAQAKWDSSEVREMLHLDAHVQSILAAKQAEHEDKLKKAHDKAISAQKARKRNKKICRALVLSVRMMFSVATLDPSSFVGSIADIAQLVGN